MRYLFWTTVFVIGLIGHTGEVRACSCASVDLERQLEFADYAFSGVVVDVDTVGSFLKAVVTVDEVWKGAVTSPFEVWTQSSSAACGYNDPWARFELGVKFVLYAFDSDESIDRAYTNLCTRNRKYEDAAEDLVALGDGEAPALVGDTQSRPVIGGVFPNPARRNVTMHFTLLNASWVELTIYDVAGRKVKTLAARYFGAGDHELVWQPEMRASGMYFMRLMSGNTVTSLPIVVSNP